MTLNSISVGALVAGAVLLGSSAQAGGREADDGKATAVPAADAGAQEVDQFAALDLNGDGVISRGEIYLLTGLARQFNQADRNGDGEISRAEFSAFEAQVPTDRPAPPVHKGTLAQWRLFELIDQDGDGHISPEEAELYAALEAQFAQADRDRDGAVDRIEFAAFELQEYERAPTVDEVLE